MSTMQYSEMKDSSMEWAGKIPKHWEQRRIKTLFALRNEKNYLSLNDVNLISLYTEKGVVQHDDLEETTGNKASNADGYKKVYENDIVVNIILCWMGAIGRSAYNGVTSPAYDVYRPLKNANSRYFHYYFRTTGFNGECYKRGKGIMAMRWRTYSEQFMSIRVACPPLAEQETIAAYLDEKCAMINEIIEQAKATIEEYKAWKTSVIFEAVTKGLDPNAEMKDSGVEWIGKTPKKWTVSKQKYFITLINGRAYSDDEFFPDGKYRVLRVGNFFTNTTWYYSNLELDADKYCEKGDLLYAWSASYGPKIWDGERVIFHYHIWKCKLSKVIQKQFCYYYFLALSQFSANSAHGTAMMHITMKMMDNTYMPIPPISEQESIAAHLDKQCATIDGIIAEKQKLIDELENYKKSLIFETVTGKRRVCS